MVVVSTPPERFQAEFWLHSPLEQDWGPKAESVECRMVLSYQASLRFQVATTASEHPDLSV